MSADTAAHIGICVPPARSQPELTRTASHDEAALWDLLTSLPADHPERHEIRNQLVAMHMPLVRYLARRYRDRGEALEDLIQVGAVGLIKSVDRFDSSRGVVFSTFATPTILGEIKRHFRDKAWMVRVPRQLQELKGRLGAAREQLAHQLGRSPTIAELAEFLDLTEEQVLEGFDAANAYSATSIDAPALNGDEGSVGAAIEARLGAEDAALDLVERRHCVAPLLDELPERERAIIFLRFFREKTQAEIAEELGLSQMHVSRLLSQTLSRMHDKLALEQM